MSPFYNTINLTAVKRIPNACHRIWNNYIRLKQLLEKLPTNAAYRQHTETIVDHRLECLKKVSESQILT